MNSTRSVMQQLPLPLGPDPEQTFDNFVVGRNELARTHLFRGDLLAMPVYLWGDRGAGKTHLLSAAAHRIAQGGGQVTWLGPLSKHWPASGTEALHVHDKVAQADVGEPAASQAPHHQQLLVLDDCDGLDAEQQQAAFSLLVRAPRQAFAVLAAGGVPPVDLPLREDLRTRLAQGLVFRLEAADEPAIRHALAAEARRRGLNLSNEVSGYLLTHFSRDLKSLMNVLDQLDRFAWIQQRALTVPLLKQMINSEKMSP